MVLPQRGPQRGRGTVEEAVHPGTLAARVVIVAGWFARRRFFDLGVRATPADVEILALIARVQLAIQTNLDTQALPAHVWLDVFARDLKLAAGEGKRIVI